MPLLTDTFPCCPGSDDGSSPCWFINNKQCLVHHLR